MKTLSMHAPDYLMLNQSKPDETIQLKLANLRADAFEGKVVFDTPEGIEVSATDGDAVSLGPDAHRHLSVRVKATDKVKVGIHSFGIRLVDAGGTSVREKRVALEWLGPMERKVIRSRRYQAFCVRAERLKYDFIAGKPRDQTTGLLAVSGGARSSGDASK